MYFDAISVKVAGRFFGSNILFRGMVQNTITIYRYSFERGDIYTHHKVEYNSYGYPVGVVPQYDRAKPRAFNKASDYFILRLSLTVLPVMLFILALWSGWMLSVIIGWFFAYRIPMRERVIINLLTLNSRKILGMKYANIYLKAEVGIKPAGTKCKKSNFVKEIFPF